MEGSILRRTWAEIDLDALAHNYHQARQTIGPEVKYMGVVKADAYGHGAVQVSRELVRLGADYLAVSSFDEAKELRDHGIEAPVLILGYTPIEMVPQLIRYHITQTVFSKRVAEQYNAIASACESKLKIHIKIDTGMSRLGFLAQDNCFEGEIADILQVCQLSNLEPEGIFTHFAVSDDDSTECELYTKEQFARFISVVAALEEHNLHFSIRHCANSGALARYPEMYLDMVRPGIALYGAGEDVEKLNLRPVMTLKTSVSAVKFLEENSSVGYGRTFRTNNRIKIGVLPIGYADGLFRSLSNRMVVHTSKGTSPICGRICMDMTMIDLTAQPDIKVGDAVEIFGNHQSVDSLARTAGTISYEILSAVSKRVPRVYKKNNVVTERVLRLLAL